jgi:hypothetical protein
MHNGVVVEYNLATKCNRLVGAFVTTPLGKREKKKQAYIRPIAHLHPPTPSKKNGAYLRSYVKDRLAISFLILCVGADKNR